MLVLSFPLALVVYGILIRLAHTSQEKNAIFLYYGFFLLVVVIAKWSHDRRRALRGGQGESGQDHRVIQNFARAHVIAVVVLGTLYTSTSGRDAAREQEVFYVITEPIEGVVLYVHPEGKHMVVGSLRKGSTSLDGTYRIVVPGPAHPTMSHPINCWSVPIGPMMTPRPRGSKGGRERYLARGWERTVSMNATMFSAGASLGTAWAGEKT
ncbi:MAG: hypothetical protein AAB152_17345 [Candidatus Coatesbacteria bacterium]